MQQSSIWEPGEPENPWHTPLHSPFACSLTGIIILPKNNNNCIQCWARTNQDVFIATLTPAVPTLDRLVAQALLGASSPHASKLLAAPQQHKQHLGNVMRCTAVLLILGTGIFFSASKLGNA